MSLPFLWNLNTENLQEMVEHYNLMPAKVNNHIEKDELTISLALSVIPKGLLCL